MAVDTLLAPAAPVRPDTGPETVTGADAALRGHSVALDVAPDVDNRPGRQEHRQYQGPVVSGRGRRVSVLALLSLFAVFGVGGAAGWAAMQLADTRAAYDGRILPGVTIAGVDVAGLDRAAAVAAVNEQVGPLLEREVTLTSDVDGLGWTTTPAQLGATSDAEAAVDEALASSADPSWTFVAEVRFAEGRLDAGRDVAVDQPVDPVRDWIASIAAELDREAVDASAELVGGEMVFTQAVDGARVLVDATAAGLHQALVAGGEDAHLGLVPLPATTTDDEFAQTLVVHQSRNVLEFYEDGQLAQTYPISTGTSGHPTPLGEFTVSVKREMPSWVNPAPDGWGSGMPAQIAPGPGNPLGLRALNWVDENGADDGIRFHGTNAVGALGGPASKGCVRLSNPDVVDLFDRVDVGARIISAT